MKSLYKVFSEQFAIKKQRNWDYLYVAIDWHDTIVPGTYSNDYSKFAYYKDCVEVLQMMSRRQDIKLILFTSSYPKYCDMLLTDLAVQFVTFDFVNCNSDVPNTETGNFSEKFYYNVLLDDKAGFQPETDWTDIKEFLPVLK